VHGGGVPTAWENGFPGNVLDLVPFRWVTGIACMTIGCGSPPLGPGFGSRKQGREKKKKSDSIHDNFLSFREVF